MTARLAILYEHPTWFNPLFAELHRQGVHFEAWRAESLLWSSDPPSGVQLVLNRMSASARWRGHEGAQFAAAAFLRHLEDCGVETINGSRAYEYEISKARQIDLFRKCGVPFPPTFVINHRTLLADAAAVLDFPILFKPSCGGAGHGICRFDSPEALRAAGELDFGADHTALVQAYVPPHGGRILRVEVLGSEVLYSMSVEAAGFQLCPADTCAPAARQPVHAPREVEDMALALARHASIDAGGFEFLFDARCGRWLCYDVNALSNFAANAVELFGFDPYARLVDYLQRRLGAHARLS